MANNPGIRIQNISNNSAELLIFEEIDPFWGVGAKEIVEQLNRLVVNEIIVRINSPGGDVFEGFAIYNALIKHPAKISVDIEGLAASIASVIAMAGDEVRIAANGMVMIHDPVSAFYGGAEDFRKRADLLEQIAKNIVDVYHEKTDLSADEIANYMAEETWFDAKLAESLGFVDSVTSRLQIAAKYEPDRLKNFTNTPEEYLALKVVEPVDNSALKNRLRLMSLVG